MINFMGLSQKLSDQFERVEEDLKTVNDAYVEVYKKINNFRAYKTFLNIITFGIFSIHYNSLLAVRDSLKRKHEGLQRNLERLNSLAEVEKRRISKLDVKRTKYKTIDDIPDEMSDVKKSENSNSDSWTPPVIIQDYSFSNYSSSTSYSSPSKCDSSSSSDSSGGGCD